MKNKNQFMTRKQSRRQPKETCNNVVIYTRVSTKEQFETNSSLETQKKVCMEYAYRNGFNILQLFGDTYESAKSDKGRKHFQAMLTFVKKNKKSIHGVLVYDYSRFSRSEENIPLLLELRRSGIEVLSATQPVDTESSTGRFLRNMQLMLATLDNEQKSERTKAGIEKSLNKANGLQGSQSVIAGTKKPEPLKSMRKAGLLVKHSDW